MRKIFSSLLTIAAVFGVMSCQKNADAPELQGPQPDCRLIVRIGTENTTKAGFVTENTIDKHINSLQIFVFDAESKLETDYWKSFSSPQAGEASVEIATFRGAKTVYAVVNRPRLVLPKEFTLANFESELTTQYGATAASTILSDLSENTYGTETTNLVMVGKNTIEMAEYNRNVNAPTASVQAAQTLNIFVKRLAALVKLEKITVNFDNTSLEDATFTIKGIYLRNVVGKSRMGLSGVTASAAADVYPLALDGAVQNAWWYNRAKLSDNKGPAASWEDFTLGDINVHGTAKTVNHCLLAYPNKETTDSNDASFGPRFTRLVIHANIQKPGIIADEADGECWYTFDLPSGLKANNIYKIENITISLFGANVDDDSLNDDPGRLVPTVTVDNWANGATLNYYL